MICVALCQIIILAEAQCPSITQRSVAIAAATSSQSSSEFTQRPVFLPIHFVDFEVLDCVLLTQLLSKCSFATTTDTDDRNAQGWPHSPGPSWFMGALKELDSSWIDLKLEIRLAQFLLVVLFDNQKTLALFNPFGGFQDGMANSFFRSFPH